MGQELDALSYALSVKAGSKNPPTIVLGIAGPKQGGKTTCAEYLRCAYGVTPIALAAPVKQGLMAMLGVTERELEDHTLKNTPLTRIGLKQTPRQLMRLLGTEWREMFDPELWVKVVINKVSAMPDGTAVVISDVRTDVAVQLLRVLGVPILHVNNPYSDMEVAHSSDVPVDFAPGDIAINYDGSYEDLFNQLDALAVGVINLKPRGRNEDRQ